MAFDGARLIADLERDEGTRSVPYDDATGKPPVCSGNLTNGIGWAMYRRPLTLDQQRIICGWHVDDIDQQLAALIKWFASLDEVRSRALGNMAFQLGMHGLTDFIGMLGAMKDQRWDAAADAALNSEWAKQVPNRAARIAHMIRTGSDPA